MTTRQGDDSRRPGDRANARQQCQLGGHPGPLSLLLHHVLHGRSAGKTRVSTAQIRLRGALKQGVDVVRSLDVIVANTLASDSAELADWKRDRHIELGGRSASAGAASGHGASMPGSSSEHLSPPAPEPPADAPTGQPPDTSAVEASGLPRAS